MIFYSLCNSKHHCHQDFFILSLKGEDFSLNVNNAFVCVLYCFQGNIKSAFDTLHSKVPDLLPQQGIY